MKVAVQSVTCLDVRGNTMGLFYPVTQSTPSALADAKTESCAPGAAPLPAMGSATLNGSVVAPAPAPTPRRFASKIKFRPRRLSAQTDWP